MGEDEKKSGERGREEAERQNVDRHVVSEGDELFLVVW